MGRLKALLLLLILLGPAGLGGSLSAQEEEDPGEGTGPAEWELYAPEFYSRGDQTFIISLGVDIPTVFYNQGKVIEHNFSPPVGGTGSLAYNYFLNSHVSVGAEIGGMFNYTVSQNTLFIIPIGARLGYQVIFRRFEFPFTLTVGMAPQRYLDMGYFGFFARGGASIYYRFNPDWSFGVNANWTWLPQWVKDSKKTVYGNIVDITIGFRYHF